MCVCCVYIFSLCQSFFGDVWYFFLSDILAGSMWSIFWWKILMFKNYLFVFSGIRSLGCSIFLPWAARSGWLRFLGQKLQNCFKKAGLGFVEWSKDTPLLGKYHYSAGKTQASLADVCQLQRGWQSATELSWENCLLVATWQEVLQINTKANTGQDPKKALDL